MFIIPMAGLSSRFFKAGYTKPKYQLDLMVKPYFLGLFVHLNVILKQISLFLFIVMFMKQKNFLEEEMKKLGISDYELVCLPEETLGQADTVYQGIVNINVDESIYIFNIDSRIIDFVKPEWADECDGYLEVFRGEGDHWSFAEPDGNTNKVLRTTEKERISELCSDGLYYFKHKSIFESLFLDTKFKGNTTKNEYYIAPLYNELISQGGKVFYDLIPADKILFCGTPDEYLALLNK